MNIVTGDVVEIELEGATTTALVLLATPEAVILDPCDGTMPIVVDPALMATARVFDGFAVGTDAAAA